MNRPASSADHVCSTLCPSGVTRPRPVMTGIDDMAIPNATAPFSGAGNALCRINSLYRWHCRRGGDHFALVQDRDAVLAGVANPRRCGSAIVGSTAPPS